MECTMAQANAADTTILSASQTVVPFPLPAIHTRAVDRRADTDFHVVEVSFGKIRYFRETEVGQASFAAVLEDILSGQIDDPVNVYAFNPVEGWARDVSDDVARAIRPVQGHYAGGRSQVATTISDQTFL